VINFQKNIKKRTAKNNIEEIKLEQSDELVKRYGQQKCQLDEIVLLDLEAQCLSDKKIHPQEIIEMTAVIINVFSKEITDTFHTYVKPSVHTKLDPFCIDLTGVTQEQADNGIPLQEAMNQFEQFLEKYLILDGNWSFITFGGWDLKTCLPSECKHKGIATKNHLQYYINLKEEFPFPKGDKLSHNIKMMMQILNLNKDDKVIYKWKSADKITKIIQTLLQKGTTFTNQMVKYIGFNEVNQRAMEYSFPKK